MRKSKRAQIEQLQLREVQDASQHTKNNRFPQRTTHLITSNCVQWHTAAKPSFLNDLKYKQDLHTELLQNFHGNNSNVRQTHLGICLWTKESNVVNFPQTDLHTQYNAYQTLSRFYVDVNNLTLKFI